MLLWYTWMEEEDAKLRRQQLNAEILTIMLQWIAQAD